MQAEADSEEGAGARSLTDDVDEFVLMQARHAVTDCALPGEHDAVGSADLVGVVGDHDTVAGGGDGFDGFGHGAQVATSVVDDGDGGHGDGSARCVYSAPLVEGSSSPMRGSRSTAIRRARPNALNTVSMM